MFRTSVPSELDIVARRTLAKSILPNGHGLIFHVAKNDAVSTEMFDSLYARWMTTLRHDTKMFRPHSE